MEMILTAMSWLTGRRCQPKPVQFRRCQSLACGKVMSASFTTTGAGEVHCRRGCIWITRDGEAIDILLYPGERLACQRGDRLVLEALDASVVDISSG
jgi:Protein of unknown function (DUF2917)